MKCTFVSKKHMRCDLLSTSETKLCERHLKLKEKKLKRKEMQGKFDQERKEYEKLYIEENERIKTVVMMEPEKCTEYTKCNCTIDHEKFATLNECWILHKVGKFYAQYNKDGSIYKRCKCQGCTRYESYTNDSDDIDSAYNDNKEPEPKFNRYHCKLCFCKDCVCEAYATTCTYSDHVTPSAAYGYTACGNRCSVCRKNDYDEHENGNISYALVFIGSLFGLLYLINNS